MIKVNFRTYSDYITDSLYQWDINQELVINGLNLATAPVVQFANANMDRAIVRNSTLESGLVKVQIPNSLLQHSLPIRAYVGIYEGETFKVIETIEIPIIPKERPYDYVFEDTNGEIYSYNKLEKEFKELYKSKLTFKQDDKVVEEYDGSEEKTVNIPTKLANPNKVTFVQDKKTLGEYDGSEEKTIDIPKAEDVITILDKLPTANENSPDLVQVDEELYYKKVSKANSETLTDLTNTSWKFKDIVTVTSNNSFDININHANNDYIALLLYVDQSTPIYQIFFNDSSIASSTTSEISISPDMGSFTVTGGDDATNSELINWLRENATLQTETTYEYYNLSGGDKFVSVELELQEVD